MWFFVLLLKNLWRRKVRSVLTCASVAIAVCAVLAMLGTAEGYEKSFTQLYENRGADLIVVRAGVAQRVSSSLDEGLEAEFHRIRGVKYAEPVLADVISFEQANLMAVYVFGLRHDSLSVAQMDMRQGRRFQKDDRRKAILGNLLAENLSKKLGDRVEVEGADFEVVGIYNSFNLLEANGVAVPLKDLQELMGRPDRVTTFLVALEDAPNKPAEVERVRQRIENIREFRGTSLRLSALATRDHVESTVEIQILKGLAWASSTLALIIGLVSMLNTMMMSVSERIREIATLRAIGWKKHRVLRMILMEAMILSVVGAGVGVLLAWPLMHFLANYRLTSAVVTTQFNLEILVKGVGMGILAGLIGAFYPAFVATRLSPAIALRHE